MDAVPCELNQIPDSIPEANPLDVPLDDIAEKLLSFLNESKNLSGAKEDIEKKYEIKKEDGDCWPADDIKRVWGETQSMDIKSSKRQFWAHVIIFQMLKRFMVYDERKPNAAQKDHDDTTNDMNKSCETRSGMKENSEDTSSQGTAELETAGAAGGVEQMLGEGKKLSKVSRSTESDSGVASGSPLSASSTDVPPSPAEVNSRSSETRNAALVNENEDTTVLLVKDCGQSKNTDYEPCSDVHDKENVVLKTGISSAVLHNTACGKAKSEKGSSNDKSAKLEREEAAGGGKTSFRKNDSAASESEEASKKLKTFGTTYIRIPLTKLFGHESSSMPPKAGTQFNSKYKLIDGPPISPEENIQNKPFYVMSYDREKHNAEWVYEILNMNTLSHYKTPTFIYSDSDSDSETNDPHYQARNSKSFTNKDYDRGHLAAAANHMWCQEAYKDTYYMSNITPQNKNLNRGRWKALEKDCRDFVKDDDVRNVHVYSGPLYLNKEYKPVETTALVFEEGKAVPTHYFKVVIVEKKNGIIEKPKGFLIANKDGQKAAEMKIKYIEKISGLKFTETSEIPKLADVDHTRTATWKGNEGGRSVTIDVRISSFKENDAEPHSLNEE